MLRKLLFTTILWLLPIAASAQITATYTFSPNTTILSSQVNANFALLANALNRTGGTMTGTLTSQGILPASDATYDIGSSGARYRNGFFSGSITVSAVGGANIVNKTGAYGATGSDAYITCDASGGSVTITAYTPVGNSGNVLNVKKIDSSTNACVIATAAGNIDGSSTYSISSQYTAIKIVSDGTNWNIF